MYNLKEHKEWKKFFQMLHLLKQVSMEIALAAG